jgi:AAA domain
MPNNPENKNNPLPRFNPADEFEGFDDPDEGKFVRHDDAIDFEAGTVQPEIDIREVPLGERTPDGMADHKDEDNVRVHHNYQRTNSGSGGAAQPPIRILSSAEFVEGFVPPDYVLQGLLQRRFIYSLTGKTGAGKTAIMLLLAAHVALGKKLGDRDIWAGKVLYFAGENADDVRMRWIALAQQMGFETDEIDVHFIAGTFKFSEMFERIRTEIKRVGDVTLLMIDTSASYFEGDNENDNKQALDHAQRSRAFAQMPGGPCVITACHPVKNAADDNLIPRGGGSFLNEIDGNLTARAVSSGAEVHWQGKFRGPDFAPLNFQLRIVTHERLKDSKGNLIPTVVASPLSEQDRADLANVARSREDEMLVALLDPANCKASQRDLARRLGWETRDGSPYQVLVSRVLKNLKNERLVAVVRGETTLTKEGKKAAERLVSENRVEPDLYQRNMT